MSTGKLHDGRRDMSCYKLLDWLKLTAYIPPSLLCLFRQWNERLFNEMYKAFADGRATKSPEDFWYQGEIGFFDFYIIPLAKKLQQCEIFGNATCEEYLNHALANRERKFLEFQ